MNIIRTKIKNKNAITLISLIITIVILIILAGVSINLLLGEDGIIERAKKSKEETLIAQYKEQIEIIKAETVLKNDNEITLEKLKDAFDDETQKDWINNTEIITDNGIDKIKLTTNDGYIFYITEKVTEYKGKGEIENKNITADMISFTPSDTNWQVDNVKDALDYLYNN